MRSLKEVHIPTLVALLVLAIGIGVTVFLVQQKQNTKVKASLNLMPINVKVSNQTAFKNGRAQVTISWQTKEPTSGFVLYGMDPDSVNFFVADVRDKNKEQEGYYVTHYVELGNLPVNSKIYYTIGVNNLGVGQCVNSGQLCTNSTQCGRGECLPMQLQTPPALEDKTAFLAQGQVLDESGQPVEGGLVFVSTTGSNLLSALTDQKGQWAVNLSLLRQADLSSYLPLDPQASRVSISAVYGDKTAKGECLTSSIDPAPPIYLGKPYECKRKGQIQNQEVVGSNEGNVPTLGTATPTALPTRASGFAVEEEFIKILEPAREGEKIATQTPEFKGIGPVGKKLKIVVHSNQELSAEIYVDENGQWQWIPPTNLEPGQHTVTLTYIDENGKTHQVNRVFYVAANGQIEETPSYSASASAQTTQGGQVVTSTPTPTLIPTSTPTITTRKTMPATNSGVPKPGYPFFWWILAISGGFLTLGLRLTYTGKG